MDPTVFTTTLTLITLYIGAWLYFTVDTIHAVAEDIHDDDVNVPLDLEHQVASRPMLTALNTAVNTFFLWPKLAYAKIMDEIERRQHNRKMQKLFEKLEDDLRNLEDSLDEDQTMEEALQNVREATQEEHTEEILEKAMQKRGE